MESAVTHNKTVKRGAAVQHEQNTVATSSTSSTASTASIASTTATNPSTGAAAATSHSLSQPPDHFRNLLDESARDAFTRPWFRLERGLRLNRLRMYVEQVASQCSFTADEKARFFGFLQNALDRKVLNTIKVINYIPEQQRIESIHGLEVRRAPDGQAKWGFTKKAAAAAAPTRRRRKTDDITATATATASAP